jgi:hypothetical protein
MEADFKARGERKPAINFKHDRTLTVSGYHIYTLSKNLALHSSIQVTTVIEGQFMRSTNLQSIIIIIWICSQSLHTR